MNWQPLIFDLNKTKDQNDLSELKKENLVWRTSDTIDKQLTELVCARNPHWVKQGIDKKALQQGILQLTNNKPENYGVWVYFPWSGQLAHTLPAEEFHELRLNRNQNKITRNEQLQLSRSAIGIVGLSVGNAVAISLALEGSAGYLKLADYDRLDLSNMNRIRASVTDIDTPKTVLCARQIYEFNPFAKIEIFNEGINENNIDNFFSGQHPLDIVVDECDDIRLKFLIRDRAREVGLPVIMETSDRGMLDIERFDLEPERPLLHGKFGNISLSDIPVNLTTEEKVPFVAPIIGLETLSNRLAASVIEIGESVSTWPQLGSDVLLGGASVSITARKILLGESLPSGRYFIDVESHLLDTEAVEHQSLQPAQTPHDDRMPTQTIDHSGNKQADATSMNLPDFMHFLVEQAIQAPSGGNSQPWKFYIDRDWLWIFHDRERSKNLLDPNSQGAYIALGAAIENIRIAAAANNYDTKINYFPTVTEHLKGYADSVGEAVAAIQIKTGQAIEHKGLSELYPYISRRMTDRKIYGHIPLANDPISQLQSVASERGLSLQLLQDEGEISEIAQIIGIGDQLRFLCQETHQELMSELRWSAQEAAQTGDGLDIGSLRLSAAQETGLKLIRRPEVARLLREQSGGSGLTELSEKAIRHSSAVGLLSLAGNQAESILMSGQTIQSFWLKATQLGLSLHPTTALIYMFNSSIKKDFLSDKELDILDDLEERFFHFFPDSQTLNPLFLFRLSIGESSQPTAHRRPLAEAFLPTG